MPTKKIPPAELLRHYENESSPGPPGRPYSDGEMRARRDVHNRRLKLARLVIGAKNDLSVFDDDDLVAELLADGVVTADELDQLKEAGEQRQAAWIAKNAENATRARLEAQRKSVARELHELATAEFFAAVDAVARERLALPGEGS